MDPLLLAGGAAALIYFLTRKKKAAAPSFPVEPPIGPEGPDVPAPPTPTPGTPVPNAPPFPGAKPSVEHANAVTAHAQWLGSEGAGPGAIRGQSRKSKHSDADWLTNWAFYSSYPSSPIKIPSGWATKPGWKPWVDAWQRINNTVKQMLSASGTPWA